MQSTKKKTYKPKGHELNTKTLNIQFNTKLLEAHNNYGDKYRHNTNQT